jgi:hypothetical protein
VADPTVTAGSDADGELIAADDGSVGRTPHVPTDNTTLVAIAAALEDQGYGAQFEAVADGKMRCTACGQTSSAADFIIDSVRRLEGASDPDDMLSVVAARCPRCDALGTAVLGFGPASSPEDADVSIAIASVGEKRSRGGG